MRAIRGLYVIRSGGACPQLSALRADEAEETEQTEADDDGRLATLEVNFSRFGNWYEINSFWEGRFLERTAKGAFKKTMAERGSQVKVLFNHGFDFSVGDKVLSVPEVLEERDDFAYLDGPLFDTSYNRDLLPGLRAGAYGSSFMFEVLHDEWEYEPESSDDNPDGIPERTITEVRLYEAGPVTWPANPEATAGVRSGTDWLLDQLQRRDPDLRNELVRSLRAFRAANSLGTPDEGAATLPATPTPEAPTPAVDAGRQVSGINKGARARALRELAIRDLTRSK